MERQGRLRFRQVSGRPTGPNLRFAEFFAGIGLVRMGLERAGWSLEFANDIDPQKLEMYEGHFGDASGHFADIDIHAIDGATIRDIELATASFPCTDLSLAGARLGFEGKHSSAFWGFAKVLREMGDRRPPLVMLENVVGFLTSHGGEDFRAALSALNVLGYAVDAFVLDAKWFVPQSRPRLFVIGSMIPDSAPATSTGSSRLRPPLLQRFIAEHPEIKWQLRDLPEPPAASPLSLRDIIEDLPNDAPEWWNEARTEYLYKQFSKRHREVADALIKKHEWSYSTVFRRVRVQPDGSKRSMGELRTDGIAGCLRTPKGGSGRQILVKAGYDQFRVRLVTPRECARLMGAEDFEIVVPDNQAYFGFGDAVCVPAITWIACNYLSPLVANPRTARGTSKSRMGVA